MPSLKDPKLKSIPERSRLGGVQFQTSGSVYIIMIVISQGWTSDHDTYRAELPFSAVLFSTVIYIFEFFLFISIEAHSHILAVHGYIHTGVCMSGMGSSTWRHHTCYFLLSKAARPSPRLAVKLLSATTI